MFLEKNTTKAYIYSQLNLESSNATYYMFKKSYRKEKKNKCIQWNQSKNNNNKDPNDVFLPTRGHAIVLVEGQ